MATSIQVIHEGVTTELFPLEQIPIRLNLSNIENNPLGDIHGALSQSFTIPGSADNNEFFNFLYSRVTSTGPGFHSTVPCTVKDGSEILFEGELSLDEVVDNGGDVEYVCSIEDRTLSLNDLLSSKRVVDLDPSGLIHDYTGNSVVNSWKVGADVDFTSTSDMVQCGTWTLPENDEHTIWTYVDCDGNEVTVPLSAGVSFEVTGLSNTAPTAVVNIQTDFGFGTGPVNIQIPVVGLFATFSNGTDVMVEDSSGDEALTSGRVFYPLIDQGSDGTVSDDEFPYISTNETTITSESSAGNSWIRSSNDDANVMRVNQLSPATSVPVLIDKIFKQADESITWESDFVDRFLGQAYILPKAYDGLGIITDSDLAVNGFRSGVDATVRTFEYDGTAATNTEIRNRTQITGLPTSVGTGFNGSRFTFPVEGTYELSFGMEVISFDLSDLFGGAAGQFHDVRYNIEIYNAAGVRQTTGLNVEENPIQFKLSDSGSATTIELGQYEATTRVNAQAGWYAEVYTEGYRNKGNKDVFVTISNASFSTSEEPLIWEGAQCNPLLQFDSDLLSLDLLTSILRQFNLVIVPDERQPKHYLVVQYNDWIRSGTTQNWTYKLDRSQGISTIPLISEQTKAISFLGAEEDDPFSVESRNQSPRRELGSRLYPTVEDDGNINTSKAEGTQNIGEFFSPIAIGNISGADQTLTPADSAGQIVHTYSHNDGAKDTVVFAPKIGFRSQGMDSIGGIYVGETTGAKFS